jgi:hypothetical protein
MSSWTVLRVTLIVLVGLLKAVCAEFSSLSASNLASYWDIDYDPGIVLSSAAHKDIRAELARSCGRYQNAAEFGGVLCR